MRVPRRPGPVSSGEEFKGLEPLFTFPALPADTDPMTAGKIVHRWSWLNVIAPRMIEILLPVWDSDPVILDTTAHVHAVCALFLTRPECFSALSPAIEQVKTAEDAHLFWSNGEAHDKKGMPRRMWHRVGSTRRTTWPYLMKSLRVLRHIPREKQAYAVDFNEIVAHPSHGPYVKAIASLIQVVMKT